MVVVSARVAPSKRAETDLRMVNHPKPTRAARQNGHRCIVHRLDRQLVGPVGFEAAEVARHVEGEHLAAPVRGELHRAEKTPHDKKEILRRIAFAHDLLFRRKRNDRSAETRNATPEQFRNCGGALVVMFQRKHLSAPSPSRKGHPVVRNIQFGIDGSPRLLSTTKN